MDRPTENWQNRVRGLLRAELGRRNVNYPELVTLLAAIGVKQSEATIANKLSRGSFNAIFMVQVLDAIGCRVLRLKEDD
jgi:hypothetical protein